MIRRLSWTPAALAAALCAAAFASACDREDKPSDKKGAEAPPSDPPCTGATQGAGLTCVEPGAKPLDPAEGKYGLGDECKFSKNATGGCIQCDNHPIPTEICTAVKKADFDPTKDCKRKDDEITCNVGLESELKADLTKRAPTQKLYDNMSLIIFVAKAAIQERFEKNEANKTDPDKKRKLELFVGILDVLEKYKKAIFTLGDMNPAVDDVAALAKATYPDKIDDAKLTVMKDQIKKTIANLQERRKTGSLTNADIIALASGWLGAVPQEALGGSNIGELLTMLQGFSGNSGELAKILDGLTGGDD